MNEHCSIIKCRSIKMVALGMALACLSFGAKAQTQLDEYVQHGLANNESIKEQEFVLERGMHALSEARTLFMPQVSLLADYLLADGGRTIDFPAGDLLNQTYSTLNELTDTQNFPQLENQNIQLNPNNFYDARFRTSMPLVNAEIVYNRRIKSQQVDLQKLEIDIYKRELVKAIKQSYFDYLMAGEAVNIYRSGLVLTKENLRINKALFNNGKANRTAVIRSENEVIRFESLINVALQEQENAKAYFNFLLNREADAEIQVDETHKELIDTELDAGSSVRREELKKLALASEINANTDKLSRSYLVPKLNTFLDVGSQGFDFEFNSNSVYYLFGLSLQWDLFASNRNKYKTKQVEADAKVIRSKTSYAEDRLKLQLTTSMNNLTAAVSKYSSAQAQLISSERYYKDLLKQYKEGQILFIELLDGQNQLISSRLNTSIALYDTWSKMAEIERANASFDLNNNTNDTYNQK